MMFDYRESDEGECEAKACKAHPTQVRPQKSKTVNVSIIKFCEEAERTKLFRVEI